MTTTAQAGLTLDILSGTPGNAVAINSGTTTVSVDFWANVTGTNGTTTDDGLNGFLAAFLSTKNVPTNTAFTLSKGNLTFTAGPDLTHFPGSGSTSGSNPVAQADLDLDGDKDLGATSQSNPAGWFSADGGTGTGPGGLNYVSGPQHLGSIVYTQTAFDSTSHGITQIFAKTQKNATTFIEMDGVLKSQAIDSTSQRVTLYATGAADAGPDQSFALAPGSVTLTGSASVGSMNHWIWAVSLDGGTTFNPLTDSLTDTVTLPWATFGIGSPSGNYTVRLTTEYTGVGIPSDNASTDTMLLQFQVVPEPGTMAFMAVSGVALAWFRRRRRTA